MHSFLKLKSESTINKKTSYLELVLLKPAAYLFDHDDQFARVIFKVRTRMFDIKIILKRRYKHKRRSDNTSLYSTSMKQSITKLRGIAKHLIRHKNVVRC